MALVQQAHGTNGTCTFANPTAAGNLVVALVCSALDKDFSTINGGDPNQLDDTGNNHIQFGAINTDILYNRVVNGRPGGATTFAVTSDSPTGIFIWAYEISTHVGNFEGADTNDSTQSPITPMAGFGLRTARDCPTIQPLPINQNTFFCMALCCVDGGAVTGVDSPWTLDAIQGGNAVAYLYVADGSILADPQPIVSFQGSSTSWGVSALDVNEELEAGPALPGKIIVSKATEPAGSTQSFSFTTDYGPSFTLQDGDTNDSGDLTPGTYSVSEAPVAGWTSATNLDPSAVVVGSGETVRLIFTNTNVVGGTGGGGSGPLFFGNTQPWLVSIEDQQLTVNDLDGGADLADLVFTVQDRRNLITADFPDFVFEGKGMRLLAGFEGMKRSDFVTLFTGRVDSVESTNSNLEYIFTCPDVRTELSRVIYTVADDGFATSSDHVRTLNGHPLDILLHALEDELGLAGQIDAATIIQYRDTIGSGWQMTFTLDSPPVAKDFLENEIMKPLGAYLFSNNLGLISVNFFYPFSTTPVFAFSPDNLTEIPEAGQTDLINQVSSRFDSNGSDFKQESITEEPASVAKYGLYGSQIIESKGLRSGFNGFFLSRLTAFLIFLRYGFKALCHGDNGKNSSSNPVNALWNACTLEPGDLVSMTHPQIPNRAAGTLGIVDQAYLVMDRTWQFFQGNVQYKLLAVDLSKFKQYLITPNGEASYTSAGATDQGKYMFLCNDSDTYSNGAPGNTLG